VNRFVGMARAGARRNTRATRCGRSDGSGAQSLQPFDELPPLPGVTITDYQSEAYGMNRSGEIVGYSQN